MLPPGCMVKGLIPIKDQDIFEKASVWRIKIIVEYGVWSTMVQYLNSSYSASILGTLSKRERWRLDNQAWIFKLRIPDVHVVLG